MFILSLFDRFVEKYTGDNDGNDDRKTEDDYCNIWNHSSSEGQAFLWRSLARLYDSVRYTGIELLCDEKTYSYLPRPMYLEVEHLITPGARDDALGMRVRYTHSTHIRGDGMTKATRAFVPLLFFFISSPKNKGATKAVVAVVGGFP
jgi:hypothetical protein